MYVNIILIYLYTYFPYCYIICYILYKLILFALIIISYRMTTKRKHLMLLTFNFNVIENYSDVSINKTLMEK